MSAKLIPLGQWAKDQYGDEAPSVGTLRRWAREAKISPAPLKHGRSYFVNPNARYVNLSDERSIASYLRDSASPQ